MSTGIAANSHWLNPATVEPPTDTIVFVRVQLAISVTAVTLARYYNHGAPEWESALSYDSGIEGFELILPVEVVTGWLPLIWPIAGPGETKGE